MKVIYGYTVTEGSDKYITMVEETMDNFSVATVPGAFLVDLFPILRYLPEWFPGAGFKRKARKWRKLLFENVNAPFAYVLNEMRENREQPSYVSKLIKAITESNSEDATRRDNIKWTAFSIYTGGADTTVSAISSFFLAMTLHPQVLSRAQAEIDSVVGSDRLPTLSDRPNLPYVEAVYKEVLRWNPVASLVPHKVNRDDEYAGWHIPKGAMVVANMWAMLHDPDTYKDPMEFNPERFLPSAGKKCEKDPQDIAFGFGRRICPGINVAVTSVWLSICLSLAVYDIKKALNPDGTVDEPEVNYSTGSISHPAPFRCVLTPRSAAASELISSAAPQHDS